MIFGRGSRGGGEEQPGGWEEEEKEKKKINKGLGRRGDAGRRAQGVPGEAREKHGRAPAK
jgi:hypothetical protein